MFLVNNTKDIAGNTYYLGSIYCPSNNAMFKEVTMDKIRKLIEVGRFKEFRSLGEAQSFQAAELARAKYDGCDWAQ